MKIDPAIEAQVERAKTFAALTTTFEPLDAAKASFAIGAEYAPVVAAQVLGFLRPDCVVAKDGSSWIMRQSPRDRVLDNLDHASITALSQLHPTDDPLTEEMRRVMRDGGGAVLGEIDDLIHSDNPDLERMELLSRAIELAGRSYREVYAKLPVLRGAYDRERAQQRAQEQLSGGYFGNEGLIEQIIPWIDNPREEKFARCFYIQGVPGVGKSFLLTKLYHDAISRQNPIILHLDFDRRGLNIIDTDGLAMELSRQVGVAIPDAAGDLARARDERSGEKGPDTGKRVRSGPGELLIRSMAKAIQEANRTILLFLDTFEVLASSGRNHPDKLFDFLDRLMEGGVRPMAIIAAGRGDPKDILEKRRVETHKELTGLPDEVAELLLKKLGAPQDAVPEIIRIANGNPLVLRLAGTLAKDDGLEAVQNVGVDGEDSEIAGGYLYRAILSRIDNKRLSQIANLGLVMARVNAKSIEEVIAPALGWSVSAQESQEMLKELEAQHWLVNSEGDGWLRHRDDVRKINLYMLSKTHPEEVQAIHKAAAQFDGIEPEQALYHRLASMSEADPVPPIEARLAALFTDFMLSQLSEGQQTAILQARGETSRRPASKGAVSFASGAEARRPRVQVQYEVDAADPDIAPDDPVLTDMLILLEKSDLVEAETLYRERLAHIDSPHSVAGMAVFCFLWMSGRWSKAAEFFEQLERRGFEHEPWNGAEALVDLVILETRAEFAFDRLVREFERSEDSLRHAQRIYRDARSRRLHEGALAYALLAENRPTTISGGWREAVGTSASGMLDSGDQEYAASDVMQLYASQGLRLDLEKLEDWDVAACLNPYVAPVTSILYANRSPVFLRYVMQLSEHALEFAQLFKWSDRSLQFSALESQANDNAAKLGALGTTADWLNAFAFYHSVPDVPLIARRAEEWRRTAAGQWVYGANAPEGWQGPENGMDKGAYDWLLRYRDRPEEAARQLAIWYDPSNGSSASPMGKRAASRLARGLIHAGNAARRDLTDPEFAATRALMVRGTGRAIAVPLAILAVRPFQELIEIPAVQTLIGLGGSKVESALQRS